VKFTLEAPAGTTLAAGIATLALLLERATLTPPAGAAEVRTTVQVDVPGELIVAGEQLNEPGRAWTVRLIEVDCVNPFKEPVTVTFCAALTLAVVAAKVAMLWLAATVTLAGICNAALLLLSATLLALMANLFRVTVQVLLALLLSVEGEQDSDEICAGAIALRVKVLDRPLRVAVRIAV
jgi:hypothetical protein